MGAGRVAWAATGRANVARSSARGARKDAFMAADCRRARPGHPGGPQPEVPDHGVPAEEAPRDQREPQPRPPGRWSSARCSPARGVCCHDRRRLADVPDRLPAELLFDLRDAGHGRGRAAREGRGGTGEPRDRRGSVPEGALLRRAGALGREDHPPAPPPPGRLVRRGVVGRGARPPSPRRSRRPGARIGPQSVLYYSASGTKGLLNGCGLAFWRLFGGCTTTYGDLCWPAGLEATRLTLGDISHNAPWDLANARLVVIWGKNAAGDERPPDGAPRRARSRRERRSSSSTRDAPRRPSGPRSCFQLRPGTDGALALALGHVLVRDGHVDRAFVDAARPRLRRVRRARRRMASRAGRGGLRRPGRRRSRRSARSSAPSTPRRSSPASGCSASRTRGRRCGRCSPCSPSPDRSGSRAPAGCTRTSRRRSSPHVKDPLDFYPPETPDGVVRVSISTARLGRDMLATNGPAAARRLGRARQPDPAEPGDAPRPRGLPRSRLPRRRRGVPDRHGARGRRRPPRQEPLRADGRHRRLLALLPPAPAEGDRAAAGGEAGDGDLPGARPASRDRPRRRSRRRSPGPSDEADRGVARRPARAARPHARQLREGPGPLAAVPRRSRSPTSGSRRRRGRSSSSARRRARAGASRRAPGVPRTAGAAGARGQRSPCTS